MQFTSLFVSLPILSTICFPYDKRYCTISVSFSIWNVRVTWLKHIISLPKKDWFTRIISIPKWHFKIIRIHSNNVFFRFRNSKKKHLIWRIIIGDPSIKTRYYTPSRNNWFLMWMDIIPHSFIMPIQSIHTKLANLVILQPGSCIVATINSV